MISFVKKLVHLVGHKETRENEDIINQQLNRVRKLPEMGNESTTNALERGDHRDATE